MKTKCIEPSEAVRIYVARETSVAALKEKGIINLGDLTNLDSLGRYKVAEECWEISSIGARQALLNDAHPQVRATATSSQQQAFASHNRGTTRMMGCAMNSKSAHQKL